LGQARLSTLDQDLNLTGYQFSNAISVLSAGYVLGQLPSNLIIGFVRPSLYLPGCAIIWSGVAASAAGVTNYSGLMGIRFVLGLCEAPLFPGALYVMATWYTRREIALRVALLSTAVPLSSGLSGLIAAAVFATLEGKLGLGGWQWLFVSTHLTFADLIRPEHTSTLCKHLLWD
jgi:MFS family permease